MLEFEEAFKESLMGKANAERLAQPFPHSDLSDKALMRNHYALNRAFTGSCLPVCFAGYSWLCTHGLWSARLHTCLLPAGLGQVASDGHLPHLSFGAL